ncbi:dTDP-4-dehydrorhamnose 3,5-epimerase family protein [Mucilaginibacter sp. X4EP1]|uniref:dTDP-4-dehydrorhamnose 3,5-epimerase family protein n=1 Tax=Mucilaginibacter sp. X4EP1 TaxID=2723092 RepID=UPI002168AD46|nr:dTDP-4-dehydrorhamnose 3,5-epimerase family protein [Mucilaginibacter sp. X4EP1]MCS3815429.1 dTDP-4-dehydrorhamnose 3,5-epimerase/CDP-3, 6-dideoxy-D-glycero-D-glycero-4-hexulose-5-epimerase [Mucilaginibacter sp. X4EP1]
MEIEKTFIEGLLVIHLNKLSDDRGAFIKTFNNDFSVQHNLVTDFKESYFSVSGVNVVRGMHFQTPSAQHTKLVYINKGNITDVVLDIRKNSATYGRYFTITLSDTQPKLVYIPEGLAHGFLSLQENSIVTYLQTSVYSKDHDHGIKWDSFGFDWGVTNPIISIRDQSFTTLGDFKSPF